MIFSNLVIKFARFMLLILSILALTTLHDLAKSYKKLGKTMHGLILPRCLAMYFQDHSRSCRIMQDIFTRVIKILCVGGWGLRGNSMLAVINNMYTGGGDSKYMH